MKKIVLLGMILCMLLESVGCRNTEKEEIFNENIEVNQTNEKKEEMGCPDEITIETGIKQEKVQTNKEKKLSTQKDIKSMSLNESDLVVTDGVDTIILDSLFDNFETTKEEINAANYVGEVSIGEYKYKTYYHQYDDFNIYSSNMNYSYKNDDMNTYYITQIDLISNKYMTARGARLGCKLEEILKMYGERKKELSSDSKDESNNQELEYQFNNYILSFEFNNKETLEQISLFVLPIE